MRIPTDRMLLKKRISTLGPWVCSLTRAAITTYNKLRDLNNTNLLSHILEVGVWGPGVCGDCSFWRLWRGILFLWFLVASWQSSAYRGTALISVLTFTWCCSFFLNCCSLTVVCIFSPSLYPTPAKPTSLPCFHPPPWFCLCVLYSSFWKPFSPLSLPSPVILICVCVCVCVSVNISKLFLFRKIWAKLH